MWRCFCRGEEESGERMKVVNEKGREYVRIMIDKKSGQVRRNRGFFPDLYCRHR